MVWAAFKNLKYWKILFFSVAHLCAESSGPVAPLIRLSANEAKQDSAATLSRVNLKLSDLLSQFWESKFSASLHESVETQFPRRRSF